MNENPDITAVVARPWENHKPLKPHQEWDAVERCAVGRDPRKLGRSGLERLGLTAEPLLKAIRRNCLDCVGGSAGEVRRCGMIACPFWPFRMSTNPWRAPPSDAQREAARRLPRQWAGNPRALEGKRGNPFRRGRLGDPQRGTTPKPVS